MCVDAHGGCGILSGQRAFHAHSVVVGHFSGRVTEGVAKGFRLNGHFLPISTDIVDFPFASYLNLVGFPHLPLLEEHIHLYAHKIALVVFFAVRVIEPDGGHVVAVRAAPPLVVLALALQAIVVTVVERAGPGQLIVGGPHVLTVDIDGGAFVRAVLLVVLEETVVAVVVVNHQVYDEPRLVIRGIV